VPAGIVREFAGTGSARLAAASPAQVPRDDRCRTGYPAGKAGTSQDGPPRGLTGAWAQLEGPQEQPGLRRPGRQRCRADGHRRHLRHGLVAPRQPRGAGPLNGPQMPDGGRSPGQGGAVTGPRPRGTSSQVNRETWSSTTCPANTPRCPTSARSRVRCSVNAIYQAAAWPAAALRWVRPSSEAWRPKRPRRGGPIRARWCVQFCLQFVPDLWVHRALKVLVEASGTTRMNSCGLGADIF
jgi:hypothetical protein